MNRSRFKTLMKISVTLVSLVVLFFMFTNENITYCVPASVDEFAKYLESQNIYPAINGNMAIGYVELNDAQAYERQFDVDGSLVSLSVKKYGTIEQAYDAYEKLKGQSVLKLIFDIDGNSYISYRNTETYYAAWRNEDTIIVVSSKNQTGLKMFKDFIVSQLTP